jgi:uncharacterized protein (DUF1330 family)
MSDKITVYMVVNLTIHDHEEYRIYEKGFFLFLKKHNGSFITYDDSREILEGAEPLPGRTIIFSFPSEEDADNWWADKGYQELSKHRRAATEITLQRVKGLRPRE